MKYMPADTDAEPVESARPIINGSTWQYHDWWKAKVYWEGDRLRLEPIEPGIDLPFLPWTEATFRRCMRHVAESD